TVSVFLLRLNRTRSHTEIRSANLEWPLRRLIPYLLIGAILIVAGVCVWWYRNRSIVSAASEFMPRTSVYLVVPAGTQIQAVLKNLFSSATKPGDAMLAFVTDPLV